MGTWHLQKDFTFEASHRLPGHDGKCQRLHGHSWKGTVIVEGDRLQGEDTNGEPLVGWAWGDDNPAKQGMVQDYGDIKKVLNPIIEDYLDHHHLNDTVDVNPTSETIARWLYRKLKPALPSLIGVRIEETCTARATYSEDEQ